MPRKTRRGRRACTDGRAASMRPRPDAAENAVYDATEKVEEEASMRPRPDAAENLPWWQWE